jgi:2-polyprenyl-6-methoxyphenol hydroxylase-like FAD-dependent oxidoreductase
MKGHAEIAGGGIGGLALGTMLRQRGWTVRVHERSAEIREIGAGIYIKQNSIRVMEEVGMFPQLAARGVRLQQARLKDPQGRVLLMRPHDTEATRVYVFSRQALIEEWRNAALAAGVDVVTGSAALAADPAGELVLETGRRFKADLVVGADGFGSRVRESLQLGAQSSLLPTVINRFLIPNRRFTPEDVTTEHYAGQRRIGIAPAGPDLTYVFTVSPLADTASNLLPMPVDEWLSHYPLLGDLFRELAATEGTSFQYCLVRCPTWQKGRVALVGDSATGMPPTLGQGAGLTIMNARALAEALERSSSVEQALPQWEHAVRFVSDMTQDWALRWDWISRTCPPQFAWLKPLFLGALRAIPSINRRMRIADRGLDVILPRLRAVR